MSEQRATYDTANLLQSRDNPATIDTGPPDIIQVFRNELEQERRHLLGRLKWLNEKLGYAPILTGKEQRRQAQSK